MTRAWLALIVGHALVFAVAVIGGIAKAGGDVTTPRGDAGEVGERHVRAFCFRQLNPDGGEPLPLPDECFGAPTLGRMWR